MQAAPDWQEMFKTDRLHYQDKLTDTTDWDSLSERYSRESKLRKALDDIVVINEKSASYFLRVNNDSDNLQIFGLPEEFDLHREALENVGGLREIPSRRQSARKSQSSVNSSHPRDSQSSTEEDEMSSEDSLNASLKHLDEKLTLHLERVRERQEADAAWTKDMVSRIEKQNEQTEARYEKHEKHFEQAEARFERYSELAEARFIKAEERFEARTAEVVTEMRETRRHMTIVSATTIGVTVGAVIAALAVAVTLMSGQLAEQSNWLRYSVDRIEQRIDQNSTPTQSLEPAQQQESEPAASTETEPSQ